MNDKIDIIVMYIDSHNKDWQKEYEKYRKMEVEKKIQSPNSMAAFSEARYRNWDIFKYWFRGVAQNCPWVNKVFLVVEDKSHVPSYLNQSYEKLRIVEHKEFVPNDLLPLFNGPAIEMWYSRIPDLANNFIACDDDYFFINPIPEDLHFENNVPMTRKKTTKYSVIGVNDKGGNWRHLMSNSYRFVAEQTGNFNTMYTYSHLPEARNKKFEADLIKKYYKFFHDATAPSHFRYKTNLNSSLFIDMMKATNFSQAKDIYKNSKFVFLKDLYKRPTSDSDSSRPQFRFSLSMLFTGFPNNGEGIDEFINKNNYQMICLNDADTMDDKIFEDLKRQTIEAFEKKFPNKCDFEL